MLHVFNVNVNVKKILEQFMGIALLFKKTRQFYKLLTV